MNVQKLQKQEMVHKFHGPRVAR